MFQPLAAAVAALLLQGAASTPTPSDVFGAREGIEQASLSPDGTMFAFLAPAPGQGTALFVVPVDGSASPRPVLVANGDPDRLSTCNWASNARIVCSAFAVGQLDIGDLAYTSRYVGLDPDGKNSKVLYQDNHPFDRYGYALYGGDIIDWLPDQSGAVLMTQQFLPEYSTGTKLAQTDEGFGVVKFDTRSGRSDKVEPPRRDAREYISDGQGAVRIVGITIQSSGYDTNKTLYLYRKQGSREWETLSTADGGTREGFEPFGVNAKENAAYGLEKLGGRLAAFKVALDGSLTKTLLFAHPQVDVDDFVRIGRHGRIIGATFATDRRETHYFDPELEKLASSLARAIPNLPLIRFVDSSADESKLLIWAGSDTDPGRYYLFDRTRKELNELLATRPQLAGVQLASVKAVSYRAADGSSVPAYLTLPPDKETAKGLPAIVMPHGGPGARDEWGFDWLSQFFAHQGYAVLQPNFRGSTGYGDEWFARNGFQSWRTAIGDVADGGRWLVAQGIADPKKLAIFGWSYGGYAALQSAVTDPGLFKAIVAVAPVTDLESLKQEHLHWSDYAVVSAFVGNRAAEASPARNAEKIKAPVLMFHGTYDRNVSVAESRLMADRLKDAGVKSQLVTYDKLDHYLQNSAVRADMLSKSDEFLRASLGL